MVLNFTAKRERERETEIAMITQLTKAKTEIHGEQQESTEEASWAHGAELRPNETEGDTGAVTCV